MKHPYLIWSHVNGAWWRANSQGYTIHIDAAGHYTREEALQICATSRNGWQDLPSEIPVALADVRACQVLAGAITSPRSKATVTRLSDFTKDQK